MIELHDAEKKSFFNVESESINGFDELTNVES